MAYQLEEINRRLREDPAGFVAECDGVYQKRLETAAERILERMKESPIVLLSGPSGSGKTTNGKYVLHNHGTCQNIGNHRTNICYNRNQGIFQRMLKNNFEPVHALCPCSTDIILI